MEKTENTNKIDLFLTELKKHLSSNNGWSMTSEKKVNNKTFTFKMYTTENFKEVVKLFKNKEIGTLQIIFIDRTGVKTMGMNLYGVSIKSIYPIKLDYTSVENVEFMVTAEYSEIGYE